MNHYPIQFVSKRHEYGTVYTLIFSTETPIPYTPGQWAHVSLNTGPERDRSMVRHLSFASAPSEKDIILTVDTVSESPFKQKLLALQPGDTANIFKIRGEFDDISFETDHLTCVAGGIGMVPVRSLAVGMAAMHNLANLKSIHVARTYLYKEELAALPFDQQHISSAELADVLAKDAEDTKGYKYVVGPPAFVESVVAQYKQLGVPEDHILDDEFTGL